MSKAKSISIRTTSFDVQDRTDVMREIAKPLYDAVPTETGVPFEGGVDSVAFGDSLIAQSFYSPHIGRRSRQLGNTENFEAYFIHVRVKGHAVSNEEGRAIHHGPGDIYISDVTHPFEIHNGDGSTLSLIADKRMLEKMVGAHDLHGLRIPPENALGRFFHRTLEACQQTAPDFSEKEARWAETTIMELAAGMVRSLGESGYRPASILQAQQIKAYIIENIHRQDLDAQHIMEKFRLSRSALYRMFEKDHGVAKFITDQRLRAAYRDIAYRKTGSRVSLKMIAAEHGFSSQRQFSEAFYNKFGCSPSDVFYNEEYERLNVDSPSHLISYLKNLGK